MINYYKFTPLVKTLIWGTESWQISGVPGNETPCDGQKLNDLVKALKGQLVGEANYQRFGDEFPLLIKFIDAHQDLSIQVHPTDEIAHRQGKPRGKTEMWYVMDSQPTAKLYNGLKMQITPDQHAIGAGCYLAEIQQTSDVTYRIYDYKRRDKDGNLRQLHTQEAAESINYTVLPDYRQHYTPQKNEGQLLVECPYFNTAVYDLTEPMTIDYSELDSFVILIGLKGEGLLSVDGEEVPFRAGETLLIPATAREVRAEGTIKFLETYVLS